MENETFFDKVKKRFKNIDVKFLIKALTFLWGLALIILMTVFHATLDPTKLNFTDWISKTILLTGISIFGILMGESIGGDKQRSKVNGLYQVSIKRHEDISNEISPIIIYFNDFLLWFKQKETLNKKINYLTDKGIQQSRDIAKYISLSDLEELKIHPIKLKNDVIIDTKSENEIEIIKHIFDENMNVKSFSSNYYLNAFGEEYKTSELEVGKLIAKKRKNNKRFYRTIKIVSGIVISLIMALYSVKDFMQGDDASAWTDLIIRIFTLFTGLYSGWLTSVFDVKLESQQINNKTRILEKFKISYDSKEYVPIDYEDLARKHYEEFLEKEKEQNGTSENN